VTDTYIHTYITIDVLQRTSLVAATAAANLTVPKQSSISHEYYLSLFSLSVCFVFREYHEPTTATSGDSRAERNNCWEVRQCFLWDNYVFELLPSPPAASSSGRGGLGLGGPWAGGGGGGEASRRPIGYVNLSGALLVLIDPSSSSGNGNTNGNDSSNASGDVHRSPGFRRMTSLEDDFSRLAPAISLRYFASSAPTAPRGRVVLRRATKRGTHKLMQQLQLASRVMLLFCFVVLVVGCWLLVVGCGCLVCLSCLSVCVFVLCCLLLISACLMVHNLT
jgi:hypothetical protein